MAVGLTRNARVSHLDTSRRDAAVYVAEMYECALAVTVAATAPRRRRRDQMSRGRRIFEEDTTDSRRQA